MRYLVKFFCFAVAVQFVSLKSAAAEDCPDGSCPIPGVPDGGRSGVISPVGRSAVGKIRQAPRLDTLDGKTIAVVGGRFVSVKIELPAKWDELMAAAGYPPLKSFFIDSRSAVR